MPPAPCFEGFGAVEMALQATRTTGARGPRCPWFDCRARLAGPSGPRNPYWSFEGPMTWLGLSTATPVFPLTLIGPDTELLVTSSRPSCPSP